MRRALSTQSHLGFLAEWPSRDPEGSSTSGVGDLALPLPGSFAKHFSTEDSSAATCGPTTP